MVRSPPTEKKMVHVRGITYDFERYLACYVICNMVASRRRQLSGDLTRQFKARKSLRISDLNSAILPNNQE